MMESRKDGGKHGAKSRLNYHLNGIGCCLQRMDVPPSSPTKGIASTPKSIAASSFKFVLIPSLSPPDPKSICCSSTCCNIKFPQGRWISSGWHSTTRSGSLELLEATPYVKYPTTRLTSVEICFRMWSFNSPLARGFHNTVAAWLKQRRPDRSITNLHSQQSVTDSMPTKPLAIHYWEAVQGEACPTAAC